MAKGAFSDVRDDLEALGQFGDAVAVAHPDRIALADLPEAVEERARRLDLDIGAAELGGVAALDLAAELRGHASAGRSRWRGSARRTSNTACGARGLPSVVTEAGPPEKMTPLGFSRAKASAAFWNGWISQ